MRKFSIYLILFLGYALFAWQGCDGSKLKEGGPQESMTMQEVPRDVISDGRISGEKPEERVVTEPGPMEGVGQDGGVGDAVRDAGSGEPAPREQAVSEPTLREEPPKESVGGSFTLTSSAFQAGQEIPKAYGCDKDFNFKKPSPPLAWSGVPKGTKSFVLLMDDPDAQRFVHWLAVDIPGTTRSLAEGASRSSMPTGTKELSNDFGEKGYGGPCPPGQMHRYRFFLYAMPTAKTTAMLDRIGAARVDALLRKIALGVAELQAKFTPAP